MIPSSKLPPVQQPFGYRYRGVASTGQQGSYHVQNNSFRRDNNPRGRTPPMRGAKEGMDSISGVYPRSLQMYRQHSQSHPNLYFNRVSNVGPSHQGASLYKHQYPQHHHLPQPHQYYSQQTYQSHPHPNVVAVGHDQSSSDDSVSDSVDDDDDDDDDDNHSSLSTDSYASTQSYAKLLELKLTVFKQRLEIQKKEQEAKMEQLKQEQEQRQLQQFINLTHQHNLRLKQAQDEKKNLLKKMREIRIKNEFNNRQALFRNSKLKLDILLSNASHLEMLRDKERKNEEASEWRARMMQSMDQQNAMNEQFKSLPKLLSLMTNAKDKASKLARRARKQQRKRRELGLPMDSKTAKAMGVDEKTLKEIQQLERANALVDADDDDDDDDGLGQERGLHKHDSDDEDGEGYRRARPNEIEKELEEMFGIDQSSDDSDAEDEDDAALGTYRAYKDRKRGRRNLKFYLHVVLIMVSFLPTLRKEAAQRLAHRRITHTNSFQDVIKTYTEICQRWLRPALVLPLTSLLKQPKQDLTFMPRVGTGFLDVCKGVRDLKPETVQHRRMMWKVRIRSVLDRLNMMLVDIDRQMPKSLIGFINIYLANDNLCYPEQNHQTSSSSSSSASAAVPSSPSPTGGSDVKQEGRVQQGGNAGDNDDGKGGGGGSSSSSSSSQKNIHHAGPGIKPSERNFLFQSEKKCLQFTNVGMTCRMSTGQRKLLILNFFITRVLLSMILKPWECGIGPRHQPNNLVLENLRTCASIFYSIIIRVSDNYDTVPRDIDNNSNSNNNNNNNTNGSNRDSKQNKTNQLQNEIRRQNEKKLQMPIAVRVKDVLQNGLDNYQYLNRYHDACYELTQDLVESQTDALRDWVDGVLEKAELEADSEAGRHHV